MRIFIIVSSCEFLTFIGLFMQNDRETNKKIHVYNNNKDSVHFESI